MKLLFIKPLCVHNGTKLLNFVRMNVYSLPDSIVREFIEQGYACEFGLMSELPLTANYPKEVSNVR
jgi:hypothetical protein